MLARPRKWPCRGPIFQDSWIEACGGTPLFHIFPPALRARTDDLNSAAPHAGWRGDFVGFLAKRENPGFRGLPKIRQSPPPAVHRGSTSQDCQILPRARKTEVIGRRWSRWSIGTIGVRSHPRFGRDPPQNPHHAVAQGVRVQGPPGRRGKSTKLRVSDTLSFWRFLGQ